LICIDVVVVRVVDCLAKKLQGRFPVHGVIDNIGYSPMQMKVSTSIWM